MKVPEIPAEVNLSKDASTPRYHVFDDPSRHAIWAALGAGRPLLLRGEPGVGKTQLAEAAAAALNRLLVTIVVDSKTEARDLLYQTDSIRRLAEAQLCGALAASTEAEIQAVRRRVALSRFVTPGPLWWAFDWKSALQQARKARGVSPHTEDQWNASHGTVLLIDEIDKAETDVPNGLLEALGSRRFSVPTGREPVSQQAVPPLVIITTNEERSLPQAFVRRCLVLNLALPGEFDDEGNNSILEDWLVLRGKAHFAKCVSEKVLRQAAKQLVQDRFEALTEGWTVKPGQAEYLDLVRAVAELDPGVKNERRQLQRLDQIRTFVLRKERGEG